MSDRTITCLHCGQGFTFTAGEQAFYQERGFSEPQRCANCRAERKAQLNPTRTDAGASGGFGGGSRGGYSSGYGGGSRQMFPAVCSACGQETEVPFQPRTEKPVYCRDCFRDKRPAAPRYGAA